MDGGSVDANSPGIVLAAPFGRASGLQEPEWCSRPSSQVLRCVELVFVEAAGSEGALDAVVDEDVRQLLTKLAICEAVSPDKGIWVDLRGQFEKQFPIM